MTEKNISGFVIENKNRPVECIVELNYKDFIIYLHSKYKNPTERALSTIMKIYHSPSGTYHYDDCETVEDAIRAIDSDYNNPDTEND